MNGRISTRHSGNSRSGKRHSRYSSLLSISYFLFPISFFLLLASFHASAQTDSLKRNVLTPVEISANADPKTATTTPGQTLQTERLHDLPVLQLSDALKFLSGIVIKDYGGTGGLKTVSVRSLGAQHTAVAYDGISVTDCQTGQIDVGKFALDNVESVSLNSGQSDDIFLPARLFASASLIHIHTKIPEFVESKKMNFYFNLTGGSFGLISPAFRLENKISKKVYSFIQAEYLRSDGMYPFEIHYGGENDSTSKEKRTNSDIQSIRAEANLYTFFYSQSKLTAKIFYYYSERGLPGAVIFYNPHSSQRLWDENGFAQIHYENLFTSKIAYQVNGKFNYAYTRYVDPDYMNSENRLDNRYSQQEYYLSNTLLYRITGKWAVSISNDMIVNTMDANLAGFPKPLRWSCLTVAAANFNSKYIDISANILSTVVVNKTKTGEAGDNTSKFTPFIGLSIKPIPKEQWYIRVFYKNIFRLPTFNDLYYREIGNVDLKPENTHQVNLGVSYSKSMIQNRLQVATTADVYYNNIRDKIAVIPTKNLFVWSMLNYGRVDILGVDASARLAYQIIKPLAIELFGNYTFQYAEDLTDENSKTYKNQIPYTPKHSGSGSISIKTNWIHVTYSILISGKRYALGQNTVNNLLDPYTDQSISLSKDFTIKKWVLGVKVELLNLANTQYEVVRNFPMQGRSFRATIEIKY